MDDLGMTPISTQPETSREAIHILLRDEAKRLKRYRVWRVLFAYWLVCALAAVAITIDLSAPRGQLVTAKLDNGIATYVRYSNEWDDGYWPWLALVAVSGCVVLTGLRNSRAGGRAAELALTGLRSPAAVGPLSTLLGTSDRIARAVVQNRLLYLLPRLKPADAGLLDDSDHARLNRALRSRDAAMALAVLAAWEQVGDERDLLAVQYVAEGLDIGRRDWSARVAASECLPFLQKRAEERQTSATLLRPCDSAADSTSLLRPAVANHATDADSLLRAPADP